MLVSCVEKMMNLGSQKENFGHDHTQAQMLNALLLALVWLVLVLLVAKFLWNNALVELVSFVKPCKSVLHLLGLALLLDLLCCK